MRKTIYIETSIVSYLTARPSRDLVRAARQEITFEWWEQRRGLFRLYTSAVALAEAAGGNRDAADRRVAILREIPLLRLNDEIGLLAQALVTKGPLPKRAVGDAAHLAVAAVHNIDLLLTWNCRHLANAELMTPMADFLRSRGYRPPLVCTPEALMGE